MDISKLKQKWSDFVGRMNQYGVPLPTVRDPKTGLGSISLTLVFVSFNIVLIGLVGKWAGALGGIDLTQALNLFYACAALYWGRKFQRGDSSIGDVDPKELIQASSAAANQSSKKPESLPKADDPDQQ